MTPALHGCHSKNKSWLPESIKFGNSPVSKLLEKRGGHAKTLAQRLETAELRWHKGDHQLPSRHPEEFVPFIRRFLADIYPE